MATSTFEILDDIKTALTGITGVTTVDIGIPADIAPDYWRHLGNRLTAGEPIRLYTPAQHRAWLKRRRAAP